MPYSIRLTVVPGLDGTAGYLVALILLLKGYDVRGVRPVDMPASWTQVHPGYRPDNALRVQEKHRPGAVRYFQAILADGTRWTELRRTRPP
ncbi:MAG: hypothetical protein NDJ90_07625 [Oligoflexia bacterium]|nr:hypothetical protein [Oligoflexia bacterium]